MGKAAKPRRLPETAALATARMIKSSPQKLNLVAQSIRGLPAERALAELEFSQKRVSEQVRKCLESAIANAENNHDLDIDALVVAEAYVGKDLILKRFRPRARGRVGRIQKSFSRLTIVVREEEEA
jgi:large subunit ribosomal protein L22